MSYPVEYHELSLMYESRLRANQIRAFFYGAAAVVPPYAPSKHLYRTSNNVAYKCSRNTPGAAETESADSKGVEKKKNS